MDKGLIHIYTGDGKGKTTCAVGLAIRCAGYGKQVNFIQFLKSSSTGELIPLENAGIVVTRINTCNKFYYDMTHEEKRVTGVEIENFLKNPFPKKYDLVILDEILCALSNGIINTDDIIKIIKQKPINTELIITGINMPDELIKYADYVSEIKCIKHPYSSGINARCGIDF